MPGSEYPAARRTPVRARGEAPETAARGRACCGWELLPARGSRGDRRAIPAVVWALLGGVMGMVTATAVPLDRLPRITAQPQSVAGVAGGEVVLYAQGYGAGELSFQWLHGEAALSGATDPVLRIPSLDATQAGDYRLVIANLYGRATSDVARVTVEEASTGAGPQGGGAGGPDLSVGFINRMFLPGFTAAVVPLLPGGPGETVFGALRSLPDGMVIYQVKEGGFTANAALGGWQDPAAPLRVGEVFFIFNPFDVSVSMLFLGRVITGDLWQSLPAGYSLAGSLAALSGPVVSTLSLPAEVGDQVLRWDAPSRSYRAFTVVPGGWLPEEPSIGIAEAFVVRRSVGTIWKQCLSLFPGGSCSGSFPFLMDRVSMSFSTAQLHFFTFHPDPAYGRVENVGSEYLGQLYVGLSTNEADFWPVGTPTRFRDGAYAGYLDGGIASVPGVSAGTVLGVQLRLWCGLDGSSYETALAAGGFTARSELVPAQTEAPLVGGRPGVPPRPVNHFRTLRLPVPRFVTQPMDVAVPIGQEAVLSANAAGEEPLRYQWHRNGVAIPGADRPELSVPHAQRSDAGDYSVTVSNVICMVTSTNAHLAVYEPARIRIPPMDTAGVAGGTARFTVVATGEPPLRYEWRSSAPDALLANRLVGGATPELTVTNLVDDTAGDYWVEVRSPYDAVLSSPARLEVTNLLHLALDTPSWTYVTGGDSAWRVEETPFRGTPSVAGAGPLLLWQEAWMEMQTAEGGVLTFWWTTTERELQVLVDGVTTARVWGAIGWEQVTVRLSAGPHRVRWLLRSWTVDEEELPSAQIDEVRFRPEPRLRITAGPPGTVRLAWPQEALGVVLEQTSAGTLGGSWRAVSEPAIQQGSERVVLVPSETSNRWFRLHLP